MTKWRGGALFAAQHVVHGLPNDRSVPDERRFEVARRRFQAYLKSIGGRISTSKMFRSMGCSST